MSADFVVCWHCTLELAKWLERWTNKRPSKRRKIKVARSFYECATSIVKGPIRG